MAGGGAGVDPNGDRELGPDPMALGTGFDLGCVGFAGLVGEVGEAGGQWIGLQGRFGARGCANE